MKGKRKRTTYRVCTTCLHFLGAKEKEHQVAVKHKLRDKSVAANAFTAPRPPAGYQAPRGKPNYIFLIDSFATQRVISSLSKEDDPVRQVLVSHEKAASVFSMNKQLNTLINSAVEKEHHPYKIFGGFICDACGTRSYRSGLSFPHWWDNDHKTASTKATEQDEDPLTSDSP